MGLSLFIIIFLSAYCLLDLIFSLGLQKLYFFYLFVHLDQLIFVLSMCFVLLFYRSLFQHTQSIEGLMKQIVEDSDTEMQEICMWTYLLNLHHSFARHFWPEKLKMCKQTSVQWCRESARLKNSARMVSLTKKRAILNLQMDDKWKGSANTANSKKQKTKKNKEVMKKMSACSVDSACESSSLTRNGPYNRDMLCNMSEDLFALRTQRLSSFFCPRYTLDHDYG